MAILSLPTPKLQKKQKQQEKKKANLHTHIDDKLLRFIMRLYQCQDIRKWACIIPCTPQKCMKRIGVSCVCGSGWSIDVFTVEGSLVNQCPVALGHRRTLVFLWLCCGGSPSCRTTQQQNFSRALSNDGTSL